MTIDIEEYTRIKKRVDGLRAEADRAEGAREAAMAELRERHGCKTVAAAEKLLKRLEGELADAEAEYKRALAAFREEFGDLL